MADILSVLEEFKGVSDLYIGDIPEKKLKNALKNYGTIGDVSIKDETVVALIDCTVMGSAKSGIMFGDKTGIFQKNLSKAALLTYRELLATSVDDISINESKNDYEVAVGHLSISTAGSGCTREILRDILIAIKQSSQDDYHQVGDNDASSEEPVRIKATKKKVSATKKKVQATRKKASSQVDPNRQSDDDLFGIAWREVEDGEQNQGLWARLFVENDGDADQTKVMYLKERVMELREEGQNSDNAKESIPGQLVIRGTQLVMDFVQHPIDDVNSKEKLRKVLLEYLPQRHLGDRDSCLLAESFEDGSGNSIEVNQDRDDPWRVIPKPEIGNIVFVAYYTYSDEIYRTSYQDLESVIVLTKEFSGDYEEYVTKIVENDVELVTEIDDTGEHDGDVRLSFEIHSEEHGMADLSVSISHLDYDSEDDVNEMVDNVYERLEPYL